MKSNSSLTVAYSETASENQTKLASSTPTMKLPNDNLRYLPLDHFIALKVDKGVQLIREIESTFRNLGVTKKTIESLTGQELKIINHIGQGLQNKEIAAVLYVSVHTVQTHRKNIYRKLKINSIADLVKLSLMLRLV